MRKIKLFLLLLITIICLCGCETEAFERSDIWDEQQKVLSEEGGTDSTHISNNNSKETIGEPSASNTVATEEHSKATTEQQSQAALKTQIRLAEIPQYDGKAYVTINNNTPLFAKEEITHTSFETYGALDSLGRCTTTFACVGKETMPKEERGEIGQIKPAGWHTVKYNGIDGNYLYNRCHLIAFCLTGENANVNNLITGTRYMNIEGMLPFEEKVANYIDRTSNHVMYRVTPMFDGNNLIATGVLMEGYSVEDSGAGIKFCVFAYNVQPGITIDYATGKSSGPIYNGNQVTQKETQKVTQSTGTTTQGGNASTKTTYILNTNTKKFHYESCSSVDSMAEKNKRTFSGTRDEIVAKGYSACGRCHP